MYYFFFSSRRRHTRSDRDWSSDVCSSDLVGEALGLDVRLMAHVPVRGAHPVASIRKGRHVLLALRQQVPADVIAVQVGHHHHADVLRPHSIGLEVVHELAPRRVGRVGWLGTETRIDEDRPPVGPYQVRTEIEADLMLLRQEGLVRPPVVARDGWKEVTRVELEHPV